MTHYRTKWPQPPDPRPALFGARGFAQPYAIPVRIKCQDPTPLLPAFSPLINGVVLGDVAFDDDHISYENNQTSGFSVLITFTKFGANPDQAAILGWAIAWTITLQFAGVDLYQKTVNLPAQPGGVIHVTFIPDPLFPNIIPWPGLITCTGFTWNTPITTTP